VIEGNELPKEEVMTTTSTGVTRRTNVIRFALTGAIASAGFFVLCWLGTFVPFSSPTHGYIGLFTNAETNSAAALLEGGFWSLAFGLVGGAILALAYNLTGFLDRG
jgi:hypothetical protein